jgi:hypothetical protein
VKTRTLVVIPGLAAAFLLASSASAAHFNFQLPVEFHKLDARINHVSVGCAVYDAEGGTIGSAGKMVSPDRQTGEAVQTVAIGVDATLGKSAFEARTYRCYLGFFQVSGATPPGQHLNAHDATRPEPGAPLITEVTGDIQGLVRQVRPALRLPGSKARLLRKR